MPLVSQPIKNLKGGISQQPDILRFPNQGEKQINGWSSESQGLQKRPPTVFLKRLAARGGFGAAPLVHLVNRDATEQYYMVFTGTGLLVYDLQGNSYTVRGYDGYANTATPRKSIRLLTVADYTFVVNREKVVDVGSTLSHPGYNLTRRALVGIRGGQYGRTITVKADGATLGSVVLPSGVGTDAEIKPMPAQLDAQAIATALATDINTRTGTTGVSAVAGPSYVLLTKTAGFTTVTTEDGYAGQLAASCIYQVQTLNKLPNSAPDGYLIEITGETNRSGDNYWVIWDEKGGVWKETVKPGIILGLNASTMPRGLVRAADGQFDWKVLDWRNRTAGDDETNPMPSLVDRTINDVFFFRNRLGFLAGENIVMSRSAKYFHLFPASVSSSADDDPIDVAVSHSRISILKYAVPFSDQLLLWSDQAQFVLTSSGVFTAKSAELNLTTEFDVQDSARPYGIGRGVYFSAPRASFTSIKRYYAVQDVSNVKSAEDISAHVPSYVANSVHSITGSGTENFVSVLSDGAPERNYIYKFLYLNEQVVQQSWSHWEFGAGTNVLASASIGSYMYLILERTEGIMLERIEFTDFTTDIPVEPYRTYIDSKRVITLSLYDEGQDITTFSVSTLYGGTPSNADSFWTVDANGTAILHKAPDGGWASNPIVTFQGDKRGVQLAVGRAYQFTYEFSKFLIKQQADDGTTSTEDIGRLQLRKVWVNYERSGAFNVAVDNSSSVYTYEMSGGRLGGEIVLGELSLGTGQYRFPVTGNALRQSVTITSNNPQPLNIIGCGFEGNYVRRSSGI
ncbi:tail protein [Pseudomonas phage PPpW-4]|uniref:Putative tail tubular protein B n=1 Tax=Pseudomonas phage PPpW-4 TaxID=1279083 RepID=V5YUX0_9CAUD|nr:tail protein [Pseudomonas phage PPpW-4]BAO20706.1 putative tail tubular protein B [Pseudomonas phage PPpW-4]